LDTFHTDSVTQGVEQPNDPPFEHQQVEFVIAIELLLKQTKTNNNNDFIYTILKKAFVNRS